MEGCQGKPPVEWLAGRVFFASPASPDDYLKYTIQTLKVGALDTHVTLGLAKSKGARYILASSSEVYGNPLVNPQPEDYWGNFESRESSTATGPG